jgi:hypothetical protein
MSHLTQEQRDAYIDHGFSRCPFCQSEDIAGDFVQVDGRYCWQSVTCNQCEENWRDVYALSSVETDDD